MELCVQRRARPVISSGTPAMPFGYRKVGQPVLIPAIWARFLRVGGGTQEAYEETFGAPATVAGRVYEPGLATRASAGGRLQGNGRPGCAVMATARGT
jgi:RNA-splicing ligase RtcB